MPNSPEVKLRLGSLEDLKKKVAAYNSGVNPPAPATATPEQQAQWDHYQQVLRRLLSGGATVGNDEAARQGAAELSGNLSETSQALQRNLLEPEPTFKFANPITNLGPMLDARNIDQHIEALGTIGKSIIEGLGYNATHLGSVLLSIDTGQPFSGTSTSNFDNFTNNVGEFGGHLLRAIPLFGNLVDPFLNNYQQEFEKTSYVNGDLNPEATSRAFSGAVGKTLSQVLWADPRVLLTGKIQDPETGKWRDATVAEKDKSAFFTWLTAKGLVDVYAKGAGKLPNVTSAFEGDLVGNILQKGRAQTVGETLATDAVSGLLKKIRNKDLPTPVDLGPIKEGSTVNRVVEGKSQLSQPAKVLKIAEDGKSAYVEGQADPVPLAELQHDIQIEPKGSYAYPQVSPKDFQQAWEKADKELQDQFTLPQTAAPEIVREQVANVLLDPLREKAAMDYVKDGSPANAAIVNVVGDPRFPLQASRLMEERGVSPSDLQTIMAGSVENASHYSGQTLQAFSVVNDLLEQQYQKAFDTSLPLSEMLDAQEQVKRLEKWRSLLGAGGVTRSLQASGRFQALADAAKSFERIRIGMTLVRVPTTTKIIANQMLTSAGDIFDAFNTGLVGSTSEIIKALNARGSGEEYVPNFQNAWADLTGQWVGLLNSIPFKQSSTLDIIEASPMIKNRLLTGLLGENDNVAGFYRAQAEKVGLEVVQAWREQGAGAAADSFRKSVNTLQASGHFRPKDLSTYLYDLPMASADLATIGLRAQEAWFRKYQFRARLEANLQHLGLQDYKGSKVKVVANDPQGVNPNPFEGTQQVSIMKFLQNAEHYGPDGKRFEMKSGDVLDFTKDPDTGVYTFFKTDAAGNKTLINKSKSPNGLFDGFSVVGIPSELREALVDAEVHALRSTWAASPDGILGNILEATRHWNNLIPIQTTMFATMFPRAMANNVMWMLHHNPTNIADFFVPEVRAKLLSTAEDGFSLKQSRDVQRDMGRALTGLALVIAGMHFAQGGSIGGTTQGDKPWELLTGEKDDQGHPKFIDLRAVPQLAEAITLGSMIQAHLDGRPNPVNLEDALAIFTNTRVSSVPALNILEHIRNSSSTNSQTAYDAMWRELGNYLAPFGNLPKTITDDWGKLYTETRELGTSFATTGTAQVTGREPYSSDYSKPDIQGQPIFGPLVSRVDKELYPRIISPFTGQPEQAPSKISELSGMAPMVRTDFERLLTRTPGLSPSMVVRQYQNETAQNMVNRWTGRILNDPTFKIGGTTLEENARLLNQYNVPAVTKVWTNSVLPVIREAAEAYAIKEDIEKNGRGGKVAPHFTHEEAARFPDAGIPEIHAYWEALLKARAKSPQQ